MLTPFDFGLLFVLLSLAIGFPLLVIGDALKYIVEAMNTANALKRREIES